MHSYIPPNGPKDGHSSMVTKRQATRAGEKVLASGGMPAENAEGIERVSGSDAKVVSDFMALKGDKRGNPGGPENKTYYADVEDTVYRIFNMTTFRTKDNREVNLRIVVLGSEGSTVRFVARGALAGYVDALCIERGDRVLVRNSLVDMIRGELKSIAGTTIAKIGTSKGAIVHVSDINREMKNVDIVGKVVSIYPIRYISRENGASVATSRITIADSKGSIDASLWGSSAIATAAMSANDFVKLEFCTVRERYGRLEIYANDLSRILVNREIASRAMV